MLSRQHRFHGYTSLSFAYRQGTTVRNKVMALRFVRNSRRQTYRAAVIVSRKVHKSAVQRNRVRRRIYEVIRTGTPIAEPYDIVLTIYNEQVVDLPSAELEDMVYGLLQKAGIYGKTSHPKDAPHDIVKPREEGR